MNPSTMKVAHVVGTRPNIMKLGALYPALKAAGIGRQYIYHTGQHYDPELIGEHLEDFELPPLDINLDLGQHSAARQYGEIIIQLEQRLLEDKPDLVVVYGDSRSTPAGAIAAFHAGSSVMHYEAGLRMHDRVFPEEFHRITADAYSDMLITTERTPHNNALAERKSDNNVFLEGDLMCDAARMLVEKADLAALKTRFSLNERYAVLTSHRHCNVDPADALEKLATIVEKAASKIQVLFPVHPRTEKRLREEQYWEQLDANPNVQLIQPLRYRDFIPLVRAATLVLSDSGGLITECVHFQVPHIHLQYDTEHPLAEDVGGMVCCGLELDKVSVELERALEGGYTIQTPDLWDGHSATRIAARVVQFITTKHAKS